MSDPGTTTSAPGSTFRTMDVQALPKARALLARFLRDDPHYLASAAAYGHGGPDALERALALFLDRPDIGFVWLAFADDGKTAVGACVVCYAISTSCGAIVAKLDDVTIAPEWQRRGVGAAMMEALADHLRERGARRIDTACHRGNVEAWQFYARQGFRPLDEERVARLL